MTHTHTGPPRRQPRPPQWQQHPQPRGLCLKDLTTQPLHRLCPGLSSHSFSFLCSYLIFSHSLPSNRIWCECVTQWPPSTAPCAAADRPEPTPSEEGMGPESLRSNNNVGTESTPSLLCMVSTEPLHCNNDVG